MVRLVSDQKKHANHFTTDLINRTEAQTNFPRMDFRDIPFQCDQSLFSSKKSAAMTKSTALDARSATKTRGG